MSLATDVDVLVVGGGPAGTACALELSRDGYDVALIERHRYEKTRIGETLPPAIRKPLTRLGVWDRFLSEGHSPSYGISSAWGTSSLYENDFIFNPHGNGWHVDRRRFDAMLAQAAQEMRVAIYTGGRLNACAHGAQNKWSVEVACGIERHEFRAAFLVDATGRASTLARRQGQTRMLYDRLIGVVSFLSPVSPQIVSHHHTLIEASCDGWWYSASLPDERLVIAYMTDADLYVRESKRSSDYWQKQLLKSTHTRSRAESYTSASRHLIFNAGSSCLSRAMGRNWLAVGDAAMAFDPLSSQGIYQALSSGLDAAHSIKGHLNGRASSLQEYAARSEVIFENYLRERKKYYGAERRWPASIFWHRRQ